MPNRDRFRRELASYLGLEEEDGRLLRHLLPLAAPSFPAIADEFYAIIRLHEGAFAVFQDEAQARRLHATLQVWLAELLAGPYDVAYVDRRSRIGSRHVAVGLRQHYMVTAMHHVRAALQRVAADVLSRDAGVDGVVVARTQRAIGRVCDFDLAIMLESYRDDFVARVQRSERLERDALAERVQNLEVFYSDAMNAADVILMGLDGDGRVVVFNPKAEEATGLSRDEVLGQDVFGRLFGAEADGVRAHMLGVREGAPASFEAPLTTRSGRSRSVRWHVSTHAGKERPAATVAIGIDVTDQRELERKARLNERLAAVGALAAGLAHEIRNPLNGATLHLAVLGRSLKKMSSPPPAALDATSVVEAEIRRLSSLVTDFLDVARPRPLARTDVDLNDLATSVTTLLRPEAVQRAVTIELEPFARPLIVHVDGERMKQVLVNLVQNAVDAVAPLGGHVVVRVRRTPTVAELEVEDDGPGIADASAPLFDAFFSTKEKGTGLGLTIVHRIVRDHGGDVTFRSGPGATVFTVRLPLDGVVPPAAGGRSARDG